jgi:hypothetical protein
MEDDWSILPSTTSSIPVKVNKRVLNQPAKTHPNIEKLTECLNDIEHIPTTPKKPVDTSETSTPHSKQSLLFKSSLKSTPEHRTSPSKASTPTKSPLKPVHQSDLCQSKRVFNSSLSSFKAQSPSKPSPLKPDARKSGSSLLTSEEFLLSPHKEPLKSSFQRDSNERMKSSYDPKLQRQKIFNQSFEFTDKIEQKFPEKVKRKERVSTSFLNHLPSPSEMKLQELSTLIITPAPNQVEIYEIAVEGIPINYSEDKFKDLMNGFHLVFIQLDLDNLSGLCKGTGKVKLRTNYYSDVTGLQARLAKLEIRTRVDKDSKGRRNDFSQFFTENWNSPRKTQVSPSKAREAKLRSLESSIFAG